MAAMYKGSLIDPQVEVLVDVLRDGFNLIRDQLSAGDHSNELVLIRRELERSFKNHDDRARQLLEQLELISIRLRQVVFATKDEKGKPVPGTVEGP